MSATQSTKNSSILIALIYNPCLFCVHCNHEYAMDAVKKAQNEIIDYLKERCYTRTFEQLSWQKLILRVKITNGIASMNIDVEAEAGTTGSYDMHRPRLMQAAFEQIKAINLQIPVGEDLARIAMRRVTLLEAKLQALTASFKKFKRLMDPVDPDFDPPC